MARDEQRKPGLRERRKEAKHAKAERTGDSPQKRAARPTAETGPTGKDAAERGGMIGFLGGGMGGGG